MTDNRYVEYAVKYKCSIAESIGDRDYPWNLSRCVTEFTQAAGRKPSAEEIRIMHPETQDSIDSYMSEISE